MSTTPAGAPIIQQDETAVDETAALVAQERKQRVMLLGGVILLILLVVGVVLAVIALLENPNQTETIRDIVIIFVAVESLAIGLVLILLIFQLARLTALLQNEVKPMLESTNETLNTLRGTSVFLSNNMVKPVIKASSTVSAIRRAINLVRFGRSK